MKKYKQLNPNQRYQIAALLETETNKNEIADIIGVHVSTIYRELNRNIAKRGRTAGKYVATNAQRRTDIRHKDKPKQLLRSPQLKERIKGQGNNSVYKKELLCPSTDQ